MPNFKKQGRGFKMKHSVDSFPFKSTEPSPNKFLGKLARGIGKAAKTVARNTPIGLGIRAAKGEFSKKNRGGAAGAAGAAQGKATTAAQARGIMGRKMGGPMRGPMGGMMGGPGRGMMGGPRGGMMGGRRGGMMGGGMPMPF